MCSREALESLWFKNYLRNVVVQVLSNKVTNKIKHGSNS